METPALIVDGATGGTNGLSPIELRELGTTVLEASTYQVLARPGADAVRAHGGLHRFLGWNGPLISDSGRHLPASDPGDRRIPGARIERVDDDGLTLLTHIDGSRVRLTPELSMQVQAKLGADIAVTLDAPPQTRQRQDRSIRWAERALAARTLDQQALFVPLFDATAARRLGQLPFDGLLVDGSAARVETFLPYVPRAWPRYVLAGVDLADVFESVLAGADLLAFDAPMRLARHGQVYTAEGVVDLARADVTRDRAPIATACGCYACATGFSRGYVRHLFAANELLAVTLTSLHNVFFSQQLIRQIRRAIVSDRIAELAADVLSRSDSELE